MSQSQDRTNELVTHLDKLAKGGNIESIIKLVDSERTDMNSIRKMIHSALSHPSPVLSVILSRMEKSHEKTKILQRLLWHSCERGDAVVFQSVYSNTSQDEFIYILSFPYFDGYSPISLSAKNGRLMEWMGKVDEKYYQSVLEPNYNVRTCLMSCVETGNISLARRVLKWSPKSVNKAYNTKTPLDIAVSDNNVEMIDFLVLNGADISQYITIMSKNTVHMFSIEDLYIYSALLNQTQFPNTFHKLDSALLVDWCMVSVIYRMAKTFSDSISINYDQCDAINYSDTLRVYAYLPLIEKINNQFATRTLLDKELLIRVSQEMDNNLCAIQTLVEYLIYPKDSRFKIFYQLFNSTFIEHGACGNIYNSVLILFYLHTSSIYTKHIEDYCMMNLVRDLSYHNVTKVTKFVLVCAGFRDEMAPLLSRAFSHCADYVIRCFLNGGEAHAKITQEEDFSSIASICLSNVRDGEYSFGSQLANNNEILAAMYGQGPDSIMHCGISYSYNKRLIKSVMPLLKDDDLVDSVPILILVKHCYRLSLSSPLKSSNGDQIQVYFVLGTESRHKKSKKSRRNHIECELYDLIRKALMYQLYDMVDECFSIVQVCLKKAIYKTEIVKNAAEFVREVINKESLIHLKKDSVDIISLIIDEEKKTKE